MCLDTIRNIDLGRKQTGGIPIPATKPSSVVNSNGSILDSIFNSAKGVFEHIASIELERYSAERLADIRAVEEQAKIAQQRTLAGIDLPNLTSQQQIVGGSAFLSIALLVTAAILIARR